MKNLKMKTWPIFTKEEAKTVSKILVSSKANYWSGQEGKTFEKEFSNLLGSNYSIALTNGTLALELALKSLDIKKGDEVIVTPRSFIASVSCVVNAGARPVFADVDLDSGNITAETISSVITTKTKAVICVHLAGWPCEMSSIMKLSKKHNFFVIEDCAQAHGATYKGRSVGSIGHIGCWSFCQDKIMSTGGEGGMVTTNDKILWQKMWEYKDHGKSFKKIHKTYTSKGFKWVHDSFGTNYRMTEIQSSIGRSQLKKLDSWNKKRNRNALILKSACNRYPKLLRTPVCEEHSKHAYYKFYTYINLEGMKKKWTRSRIINEISKLGVSCFEGSCPEIYLESAFKNTNFKPKRRLPNAKELGETSLMFLCHPTLTVEDMKQMGNVVNKVLQKASL